MIPHLLEQVKKKDRKALEEFYHKFSVRFFRSAYRYVTNEQDAGSIVNMSFFKIYNHIGEFEYRDEKSLQAWMTKIVINEALMFLRQHISYKESDESFPEKYFIEDSADYKLIMEDYYQMIIRLPDELRTVFNMFAIDGFSHNEIAARLNIKESSSRAYLTRARKMLQNEIAKQVSVYGK